MRSSSLIVTVLATLATAAPVYDTFSTVEGRDVAAISSYFKTLVPLVTNGKTAGGAPICNVKNAVMPVASPTPLPGPSAGLSLKHVAIGRGTQNYTCDTTNATAIPVAIGATATLFNSTFVAAAYPALLSTLPNMVLQYNLGAVSTGPSNPANLIVSGQHFFTTLTTPFFNLDTAAMTLGEIPCAKNNSVPAPASATKGQGGVGFGSVPWLKLVAKPGATGNLQEVYRLNTAGGSPPATCAGMTASFQVQYAAEYWFWQV